MSDSNSGQDTKPVWQSVWETLKDSAKSPYGGPHTPEEQANLDRRSPDANKVKQYGIQKTFGDDSTK